MLTIYFLLNILNELFARMIKYPKLTLFIISVILVYFFFSGLAYKPLHDALYPWGILAPFLLVYFTPMH